MPEDVSLLLSPRQAATKEEIQRELTRKLSLFVPPDRWIITHRSIDARRGQIRIHLNLRVFGEGEDPRENEPTFCYRDVHAAPPAVVVGAGPAGLFAALRLIELGVKPIVVERGKPVAPRRKDVAALNRRGVLDGESNYAFGEGGAGTFSDGKLYTRSRKRGDHKRILHRFCRHGADPSILYEAHPHIGSNRLPDIVSAMGQTILSAGGEIHFQQKVVEVTISNGRATGVRLAAGHRIDGHAVVLATGHSARDVYEVLVRQGVSLEPKAFAMGVRVEHPQQLIDRVQYKRDRGDFLPPANYRLAVQVDGRGVYSFCMCPGGIIVPAATEDRTIVVNGMSFSRRNSPFANAGIVVEIALSDIPGMDTANPLAGLDYQRKLEAAAFDHGGGQMVAPAQRLVDFVEGKYSSSIPPCSYPPGVAVSSLQEWLPATIYRRLQSGLKTFDEKMKGFLTNDAVVVGVESRTSSPVRIPREPDSLQHPSVAGLFPCGEGAGYAGGIVSCAVDGERVAEAVQRFFSHFCQRQSA